jgi:hypothetical protein
MLRVIAALLLVLATASAPLAQTTGPSGIAVVDPWARATPKGAKVGAAYMELRATAGAGDRLVSASVAPAVAGAVELHNHIMDGGVARMRRVEAIDVPAGGGVALKPGGYHVMLMDLKAPLSAGDTVRLTLTFEKAGTVTVDAPVRPMGAGSAKGSGSGSGSHAH